jgi:CubicO group peptidase (beta-lactamase class C family)
MENGLRAVRLSPLMVVRSELIAGAIGAIILAASICDGAAPTQELTEPVWPTKEWQMSTPEDQGMDSKELAALVDFGGRRFAAGPALTPIPQLDSLLVARHGKIVLEVYYPPYSAGIPHHLYSATKAVIGTLTAIAFKNGLLDSLDHRVLDFFDRRSVANLDPKKEAITVQNLLDMTSGIEWTQPLDESSFKSAIEMAHSPDWVKFVLDRPMSTTPGEAFNYSNGDTHLLSAIITKITASSAWEYAEAKLFGPLGIADAFWVHDPQGISEGGDGLFLKPRDMAKIGYLYLRNGEWEGKRVLPSTWIDRVNHATISLSYPPGIHYSDLFWAFAERHVYMAVGRRGQVIMIFPDLDIVAVTTARIDYSLREFADLISDSVKSDTVLPVDATGGKLLANNISEVSTEKPTEVGPPSMMASIISGRVYLFAPNELNLKSLSLVLAGPKPHYEIETYATAATKSSARFSGPIGLDGLYRKGELTNHGLGVWLEGVPRVDAVKGAWLDNETFLIDRLVLGLGNSPERWTLTFNGNKLNLLIKFGNWPEISIDGQANG